MLKSSVCLKILMSTASQAHTLPPGPSNRSLVLMEIMDGPSLILNEGGDRVDPARFF